MTLQNHWQKVGGEYARKTLQRCSYSELGIGIFARKREALGGKVNRAGAQLVCFTDMSVVIEDKNLKALQCRRVLKDTEWRTSRGTYMFCFLVLHSKLRETPFFVFIFFVRNRGLKFLFCFDLQSVLIFKPCGVASNIKIF